MDKTGNKFKEITSVLPDRIAYHINILPEKIKNEIQEIRFRADKPIACVGANTTYYLTDKSYTDEFYNNMKYIKVYKNDITEIFSKACTYSVYNRQNEISSGFVTINGGHRMGISGTAVYNRGELVNVKDISSLNIRIAGEYIGCSKDLFASLKGNTPGMLICGMPCCGKTTLIRDIARVLSTEYSKRVCVVDSRNEISATYRGEITNDLGFCDVFSQYSKTDGIEQSIRNMSPDFVVCDEIVTNEEISAISQGVNSGVNFVATIHCSSVEELFNKTVFKKLFSLKGFDYAVILKNRNSPGEIEKIIDLRELKINDNN